MNRDVIKGNWKQLKGEVKRQWGLMTDDDLAMVEGEYDRLVGLIQERYGLAREQAQQELHGFLDRIERETETEQ